VPGTMFWCASMSAMGEMPMPGDTRLGTAASFLGMWSVMMAAMMLPSLLPMLWRYRLIVGRSGGMRPGLLTVIVGSAYLFVWTVCGMIAFPLNLAVTSATASAPIAVGVLALIAGAFQLSEWKAHHLACCRKEPARARVLPANFGSAWRHGTRLGLHCVYSCAGLMVLLLAVGLMDLRAMAVVTVAITAERFARDGERTARAIGVVVFAAGVVVIARAAVPYSARIASAGSTLLQSVPPAPTDT